MKLEIQKIKSWIPRKLLGNFLRMTAKPCEKTVTRHCKAQSAVANHPTNEPDSKSDGLLRHSFYSGSQRRCRNNKNQVRHTDTNRYPEKTTKNWIPFATDETTRGGFTLVELAIVLVIIGLVVGGVLQGSELIKQARVRSQIKQFEGYAAALATFQLKYNQLPGDMKLSLCQAVGFTCLGQFYPNINNGNGQINDYQNNNPIANAYGDVYLAFMHLSEAKMIKGRYREVGNTILFGDDQQIPKAEIGSGGLLMFTYQNRINLLSISNGSTVGDFYIFQVAANGSFTPEEAWQIDSKWDDGIPNKGLVRAVNTNFTNDVTANSCVTTTSATDYNLTNSNTACRMLIQIF
jgi:prepilin-type N-terminal cleavage/methylation domain-containing protein